MLHRSMAAWTFAQDRQSALRETAAAVPAVAADACASVSADIAGEVPRAS
jgi:hypothetical protein